MGFITSLFSRVPHLICSYPQCKTTSPRCFSLQSKAVSSGGQELQSASMSFLQAWREVKMRQQNSKFVILFGRRFLKGEREYCELQGRE